MRESTRSAKGDSLGLARGQPAAQQHLAAGGIEHACSTSAVTPGVSSPSSSAQGRLLLFGVLLSLASVAGVAGVPLPVCVGMAQCPARHHFGARCRQRKRDTVNTSRSTENGTIRRSQIQHPPKKLCLAMVQRARAHIIWGLSFVVACVEGAAASPWMMCAREPSGPGSSAAFIKLFSPQQSLWRARRARDRRLPCPTSTGPWCLAGQG